jgi:hypothetical protein
MRMAKELEILDLPLDLAHHVQALDLLAVEDLDRHLVAGQLVEADLDLAEGADPERLAQDVVADLYLLLSGMYGNPSEFVKYSSFFALFEIIFRYCSGSGSA